MKAELEERLAEEFPFMKKAHTLVEQKQGEIFDLYGAFGCECGSGWYELLRSLCGELTAAYREKGISVDIIIDQVKEKWGGLRFCYHHSGQERPQIQAIDSMGNGGLRFRATESALHREVGEIVAKWEEYSYQVCEWCGAPGTLRKNLRWIRTLCDDCYGKMQEGE